MSQVNSNPTTRRDVLRTMASASAAMILPASTVFAFAADHPDADILRIVAELNSHLDIYEPMNDATLVATDEWDEAEGTTLLKTKGFKAWGNARSASGVEAKIAAANQYYDQFVEPLESALIHTPAKTFQGLAAKAAVVRRQAASHLWDAPDNDADWDELAVRRILDEAIAIAASVTKA